MGIHPMTLAALIAWFVTAAGGLCLLAIWLVEYDQADAATHLPRTVVSAHACSPSAAWWCGRRT
jgi:hypothetical protein